MSTKKEGDSTGENNGDDNTIKEEDKKNKGAKDDTKGSKDDKNSTAFKDQQKRAEIAEGLVKTRNEEIVELKKQLTEKVESKDGEVSDKDLEKLAEDNDVSLDFVKGLMSIIDKKSTKSAEDLVSSKLSEKEKEDAKKSILLKFKTDFDKIASEWEDVTLSESAVRALYLTKKAKDAEFTVKDAVEEIYGSFKEGKKTVEDDDAIGTDEITVGETINFDEISKDKEKLAKVLKDPKARKKYYAWRDKKGL